MAIVLFKLSKLMDNTQYADIANKMAAKMAGWIKKHPGSFSNWASLLLFLHKPFYEIVINGPDAAAFTHQLYKAPYPGKVVVGAASASSLPLFDKRYVPGKTMIYLCVNNTCQKPLDNPEEALKMII
jgi:hypothetical protein